MTDAELMSVLMNPVALGAAVTAVVALLQRRIPTLQDYWTLALSGLLCLAGSLAGVWPAWGLGLGHAVLAFVVASGGTATIKQIRGQ